MDDVEFFIQTWIRIFSKGLNRTAFILLRWTGLLFLLKPLIKNFIVTLTLSFAPESFNWNLFFVVLVKSIEPFSFFSAFNSFIE